MSDHTIVIAEYHQGEIKPVTMELITAARELNKSGPAGITICLAGSPVKPAAEQLAEKTGCAVLGLEMEASLSYMEAHCAAAVAAALEKDPPKYILIAHTVRGVALAGALAPGLNAACITGVETVVSANGADRFVRSIHGGKFTATLTADRPSTILTIQPGSYQPVRPPGKPPGRIAIKPVPASKDRIKSLGRKSAVSGATDLAGARIIVAAGRGIGRPENLDWIHRLAACFPNSAVAGSRIVCDLGWLGYSRQVGVSGNTVAPELYLACGISGAFQHLVGMRGSKIVVAVNTDPKAAIFREADVCIVEDLNTFIPAFINAFETSR
jgi:electron transfer flavoprotein alpha subunit